MHDPIAASRRIALRAVLVQCVVVGLLALGWLIRDPLGQGPRQASAAAIGGLALALGHAVVTSMALGGIVTARIAFGRLLLGTMAKWVVAMLVFAIGLVAWRLPPLPMLSGLVAGLLAYLLSLQFLAVHGKSSQVSKG